MAKHFFAKQKSPKTSVSMEPNSTLDIFCRLPYSLRLIGNLFNISQINLAKGI